jgi:hypothetical protein
MLLGLAVAMFVPRWAFADEARAARAEELFVQGKTLLAEHDYERACPLLAESFELDPGTGVLLALAICHEGEGKLASAVAKYTLAAERSAAEGRVDRERVARDRALALKSRLSILTIKAPLEARTASDFVIRRDGVEVERDDWDEPVSLDGGEYVLEASEPGKKTWRTHVLLAPSGERRTLTVPALEALAPLPAPPPHAMTRAPRAPTDEPTTKKASRSAGLEPERRYNAVTPFQIVGIAAIGAGAAGIGVGTIYVVRALEKYEKSNQSGCDGDVCVGQGKTDRLAARSAGNTATVGFVLGGALAVGGIVSFVLGKQDDEHEPSVRALRGNVTFASDGVVLSIGGNI